MKITVITVGKIKEKYLEDAIAEYSKRLSRYCKLEITEVSDEKTSEQATQTEIDIVKNKEGQYVYDGGTAIYPVDGVAVVDNYSSNWTEEQINSLRTKDQDYLGPVTSLSEVVREHSQAKRDWRSINVHSSRIIHKSVDLDYTDQNSPIEKAQLLRLSFEYNEKKKDYYLSYNSVARRY